ncbi:3-(3-hydroxy-phenyl)propionate hydroxylase [Nonomuraea solani]|uniref:3-(3-hydroxy-phenyl)propionate hydroxylase n=1 Tax=Nonomuraea solani TaxID=1144553 RepID=A0A1H6ESM4_9ACTN|nr:bifunctional 3-(3-hydroxy-phenyl)propionate/3-hydroxycinnamic acid hydroxylase [Nonomuraea solani]SEH00858.1 3-(3-hydroxy-phenyl)propionate hydroxylase [Nonomuraea solani]
MTPAKTDTEALDVIVIGGGPTGLTAATLLGRRDLRVAVVERHHDVYPLPRAVHLDDEVYRILHELGIGHEFATRTRPASGLRLLDRHHRELATFTRERATATGLPQANMFDQPDLERLMRDNLTSLPTVKLLGGHELLHLHTGRATSVTVHIRRPDGAEASLRAPYVIGCDGANSTVRHRLGLTSDDLGFDQRWLIADIRCDLDLDTWDGVHQVCDPHRAGTYMRIGPNRYRWEFQLLNDETSADFEDIPALRRLIGPWVRTIPDERLTMIKCTEYTFRARIARQWRANRVFLAGDAAHVTPPFIGQGMCAGLRDAHNLAWKIAAALRGHAKPGLLDSYEAERKPHATAMIKRAKAMGQVMTGGGHLATLARHRLVPKLARSRLLSRILLDSRTPPLKPGPRIQRHTPHTVRGTLLPLVHLPGPHDEPILIDQVLGDRTMIVALPHVDLATVPDALPSTWLTIDPEGNKGERLLARWLRDAGVGWVQVDPDRVISAAGPAGMH